LAKVKLRAWKKLASKLGSSIIAWLLASTSKVIFKLWSLAKMVTFGIPGVSSLGSGVARRFKYSFKSFSEGKGAHSVWAWAKLVQPIIPKTKAKRIATVRPTVGINFGAIKNLGFKASLLAGLEAGLDAGLPIAAAEGSEAGSGSRGSSGSESGLAVVGLNGKPAFKEREASFKTKATNKKIRIKNKTRRKVGPKT
jgi:hypothetical protein